MEDMDCPDAFRVLSTCVLPQQWGNISDVKCEHAPVGCSFFLFFFFLLFILFALFAKCVFIFCFFYYCFTSSFFQFLRPASGDVSFYRLNRDRALSWLKKKVKVLAEKLEEERVYVGCGARSLALADSKQLEVTQGTVIRL